MRKIFITLCSILLFYTLFFGFLGYSTLTLRVFQKVVNHIGSGKVVIKQVDGRLLQSWSIKGIGVKTPGADYSLGNIACSWRPGRIFLGAIHIESFSADKLVIRLKEGAVEPPEKEPKEGGVMFPPIILPIPVHLTKLLVKDVSLVTSDGASHQIVDRLQTQFDGKGGLFSFSGFSLQGPDYALRFHGSIDAFRSEKLDLIGELSLKGFGFHQLHSTFSIAGPLNNPQVHLGVYFPADIRIAGEIKNLLSSPEWRGILDARDVDLSELIVHCPQIALHIVHGDISGDTKGYRGNVDAHGSYDTLEDLHLVSDIDADWMSIDFKSLRVAHENVSGTAHNAKISWYSLFEWEGEFAFKNIDAALFSESLLGSLSVDLSSKGEVKEKGVSASFLVSNLEGSLHEYPVSGKGAIFLDEDRVYTDGFIIKSDVIEGFAQLQSGDFSWAAEPSWSGDLIVHNFNPSWLHPDFYGNVNGHFVADGSFGTDGPKARLQLDEISGTLLGNDLSGGGAVWIDDNTIRTTGLVLKNGPSELTIQGRAGEALSVDVSFASPNIGLIIPESSGALTIKGTVFGGLLEPELDLVVQGSDLSYHESSVKEISANMRTVMKSDGELTLSAVADEIHLPEYDIETSSIDLIGTRTDHDITLRMASSTDNLSFKVQGKYLEEWQGELLDFKIDSKVFGSWAQEGLSAAIVSSNELSIKSFCLADSEAKTNVKACLDSTLQLDELKQWSTSLTLQSMPLELFDLKKIFNLPVVGTVHGSISADGDINQVIKANVDLRLSGADFDIPNYYDEIDTIRFRETTLNLEFANRHLQGSFDSEMDNDSTLSFIANVEGIGVFSTPLDQITLDGLLKVENFDIELLDPFTSYSVEPAGKVFSTIQLSGTMAEPKVSGTAQLEDGGIDLPLQGIVLTDLEISLEAGDSGAILKGEVTSEAGQLNVDGKLNYQNFSLSGDLQLHGDNFELFDLPAYVINISPDVRFLFSKNEARLEGEVSVPYGIITPEAMRGSVSASEDVVFVNGEDEIVGDKGWPVFSSLKVFLGDDVTIDGYGLKGKMTGGINVKMVPNEMLTGTGELALVDGTYTLYSCLLDIKRGRVLFTGGPIDNPGVDVRAQKEISDSQAMGGGYTVGVDISGLVQDLKFDLFSDPYMDDADILSQMIVGSSMANSSESDTNIVASAASVLGIKGGSTLVKGLGSVLSLDDMHLEGTGRDEDVSLVVGKRVGKRLYIGYDMNMFSQLGQFRVRYDLSKGFAVETTSSVESTGADLLYSFEK